LRRGRLDVSELRAVVLDEADEMLDLGFREDLEFILKTTPGTRRTLLFSATLPRGIVALAKQYQKDAFRIEVAGAEGGHADIEYRALRVAAHDVEHAVVNVLRYFEAPTSIVFCATRNAVRHLQAALLERGFSVVALSGELTQSERTHALQALRDGRARVCVATDVAARGIDLPNLGLVVHAELPHDSEVMQHRSGRTGRAGRKGVSVLLVPPARRRRAEMMLDQAGVEAVWDSPPKADEIRKRDQQRLMQDDLFTEAPTEEDLTLARLLLAERTPEAIASALARMYRSRLPAPEDVLDPGEGGGRRYDRDEKRDDRKTRGDDRNFGPKPERTGPRRSMPEGSVWFRAAIGRQKNAEARWLLPMICRRGGLDKQQIGAIRIYSAHTEFEISAPAAELFAAKISRPDKDEHIRIEALPDGPQGPAPSDKHGGKTERKAKEYHGKARQNDKPRDERGPKHHGKPSADAPQRADNKSGFEKKHRHKGKPPYAGKHKRDGGAPFTKPPFGKKPKKNNNRG
jgi:ATP-dependent RNA helicase DeaD